MVSRETLGTAYLVGTGFGFVVVLLGRLVFVERLAPATSIQTSVGLLLALSLIVSAVWLERSSLDGDQVWRIAQFSGVGIGALLLLAVGTVAVTHYVDVLDGGVSNAAITDVAAGGIAGVLFGAIRELEGETQRVVRLHERNRVLSRVLRHNISNEMTLVLGYVDLLTERDPEHDDELRRIRAAAEAVVGLGRTARRAEHALERRADPRVIDAVDVVRQEVQRARERGHDVSLAPGLPRMAPVRAGGQLDAVVRNLLENAAEHSGDRPRIRADVRTDVAAGTTAITVRDDGPGIPAAELAVLADGGESPLEHGSGLGLWFVKWQIDAYGGEVAFESTAPRGSAVTVTLETGGADSLPDLLGRLRRAGGSRP